MGKVLQWYKNCSATCFILFTNSVTSGGAPTRLISNWIGSFSGWDKSPILALSIFFKGNKVVGRLQKAGFVPCSICGNPWVDLNSSRLGTKNVCNVRQTTQWVELILHLWKKYYHTQTSLKIFFNWPLVPSNIVWTISSEYLQGSLSSPLSWTLDLDLWWPYFRGLLFSYSEFTLWAESDRWLTDSRELFLFWFPESILLWVPDFELKLGLLVIFYGYSTVSCHFKNLFISWK